MRHFSIGRLLLYVSLLTLLTLSALLHIRTIHLQREMETMQMQIDRMDEMTNEMADDLIDIIEGNEIGTTDH